MRLMRDSVDAADGESVGGGNESEPLAEAGKEVLLVPASRVVRVRLTEGVR
jgi:hypothetical protein